MLAFSARYWLNVTLGHILCAQNTNGYLGCQIFVTVSVSLCWFLNLTASPPLCCRVRQPGLPAEWNPLPGLQASRQEPGDAGDANQAPVQVLVPIRLNVTPCAAIWSWSLCRFHLVWRKRRQGEEICLTFVRNWPKSWVCSPYGQLWWWK